MHTVKLQVIFLSVFFVNMDFPCRVATILWLNVLIGVVYCGFFTVKMVRAGRFTAAVLQFLVAIFRKS